MQNAVIYFFAWIFGVKYEICHLWGLVSFMVSDAGVIAAAMHQSWFSEVPMLKIHIELFIFIFLWYKSGYVYVYYYLRAVWLCVFVMKPHQPPAPIYLNIISIRVWRFYDACRRWAII